MLRFGLREGFIDFLSVPFLNIGIAPQILAKTCFRYKKNHVQNGFQFTVGIVVNIFDNNMMKYPATN